MLLHGVTSSAAAWADVAPLLTGSHELIVPTAAGHRGGPALTGRASIAALVDVTERLLNSRGLDRVHLAGNSMGGWMAIELARRGRALSVCALSPAGFWTPGAADATRATATLRRMRSLSRLTRRVVSPAMKVALARRLAMRDVAVHGENLTPHQAAEAARDMVECAAAADLLGTQEMVEPLTPAPCPITLAWSARDRLFPPSINGEVARRRIPDAHYVELPDVGHVPMIDDPTLCAETILAATRRASAPAP
ncbi:alpha/beta hydrolase [Mycobacterium sp. IDR2000157661]|nr:alpha/beta hydrolase [Mycobacterium sp. IDR2000157661]